MANYQVLPQKPSQAFLSAIARARALGLRPDQIASVTGLTEGQIAGILESEAFAAVERAQQLAKRLPLELLDFDELLDAALDAMEKMLADPETPPTTKLRIIEEIFDRDPTGALAKRTQPDRPANQPSPVFDNEAIRKVKERAAELLRAGNGEKTE
ncbi:MAG TPA: hypothetical protein PLJ71_16875 [Candidatus Hydrogenedentes bacterium]|nr:hypothetical protein [Candidatus Hydrogenedentota bacterium]HQM50364.1 hypothetical protein [Candidatus Hydrogenedentota bacterium]